MNKFSFSDTLPVTSSATAAGTQRHRQDGGARQRHQHGQRHRREHLAFDAGQREDRQVDDADDQRAEQAGLDDLPRAGEDRREALLAGEQRGRACAVPRPAGAGSSRPR